MAWFDAPLPQHLIMMMWKLDDFSGRLGEISKDFRCYNSGDETAEKIGTIENVGWPARPLRTTGWLREFYDRLDCIRDDWRQREVAEQCKTRGIDLATEAGDELSDEIDANTMTVDAAIRLWAKVENMRRAA